jgi:branched-chain amino acid transport system permease protein
MEYWGLQVFYGVSYAGLLFLLASGLTLIFGVMRIINVAHGSYYLLAGYIGYSVMRASHSYLLGLLIGAVCIVIIGLFMERLFLRKLKGNDLGQFLLTTGFALVFQDLALIIWGGTPRAIPIPKVLTGSLVVGTMHLPRYRIFILCAAFIIGLGLWLLQKKTGIGASIRAAIDNSEMAQAMGINVPLVSMGVFGLGAMVAGIAGVIGAGFLNLYPGLDFEIIPYVFIVVILGGMGSLEGAILGSLIVGLVDNFGRAFIPELSYFTLFVPMALMLTIKPTGLFGKA